ncbi:MAG: methylthioribulose 1-phosphate dehydratase [Persicimonas sp.]
MAYPTRNAAAEAMIRDAAAFYGHGWMLGTSGNLSVRLGEGRFLVTASGRDKSRLNPEDFLERAVDGEQPEAPRGVEPSAETEIHEVIYRHLPQAGAVYHVHEPHAAFCSQRDDDIGSTIMAGAEMIKGLGIWDEDPRVRVPILANHFDVSKIATDIGVYLSATKPRVPGVNIQSHGIYAWGETPFEAKRHVETFAYLFRYSWELGNGA